MTLAERIAAIDEGALDVHRSYRSLIDDLVLENQALKQENRILEARLQEARRMQGVPVVAAPSNGAPKYGHQMRDDLVCQKPGCGKVFTGWPRSKFCEACRPQVRREQPRYRNDDGEFASSLANVKQHGQGP